MRDQQDAPGETTQPRRLVLPAYSDEGQGSNTMPHVQPEQLIRRNTTPPPANPLTKLGHFWRKDPAHKVLIIAITAVVLSAIIFSVLGSLTLLNSNGQEISPNPATGATGTVVINPSFPTPSGTNGSTASSQPPKHATTTVTPDVTSTEPSSQYGPLAVQITYVPNPVANDSLVTVDVSTNQLFADVQVQLQVRYGASPFYYTSPSRQTDESGSASVPWHVHVHSKGIGQVTALVVAIATDQNGHQATSAPVTVQIIVS